MAFIKLHIVWKLLKMSHISFGILAFFANFWPNKTDMFGYTVWQQGSGFQKTRRNSPYFAFSRKFCSILKLTCLVILFNRNNRKFLTILMNFWPLKLSHFNFLLWHFPSIIVLLKLTCLVTLFNSKLHIVNNSSKWTSFWNYFGLLSTKNVNVARLARNVKWALFPWFSITMIIILVIFK